MHARIMDLKVFAVLLAGGLMFAAPAPALAQTAGAAERCRALPTDVERFACMEEALAAAEAALEAAQPRERREGGGGLLGLGILGGRGGGDLYDSDSPVAEGLGSEQIARRSDSERSAREETPMVRASIVSFREYAPNLYQFELDNGQIWRQNATGASRRLQLPHGRPAEVEMWQHWSAGYRMRVVDTGHIMMVRRVQ